MDSDRRSRDFDRILNGDWAVDPAPERAITIPTNRRTIHRLDLDASFEAMISIDCAVHR